MTALDDRPAPVIPVVRGTPTPAELAAVVVVLLAAQGAAAGGPATGAARRSWWAERASVRTEFPRPRPGGWRASALPR
jgi:acyl-CoA carboxylase epsilon subunit